MEKAKQQSSINTLQKEQYNIQIISLFTPLDSYISVYLLTMRVVIQRVLHAQVTVKEKVIGKINHGLLILVGITHDDTIDDVKWLSKKIVGLRIFDDENGVMNKSIKEEKGEILAISQFTLFASTKKGNRPSYIEAAKHELSTPLYRKFCEVLGELMNSSIQQGEFGADMQVELLNDGPVTICIDSKHRE